MQACLARGLAVVQGDADRDLADFPTRAFDYAILSQTLQQMREPKTVLTELLRIAERAIVSLPNFGHWRVRLSLLARGRMPVTASLAEPWWSTDNIHLCTMRDFMLLCRDLDLQHRAGRRAGRRTPGAADRSGERAGELARRADDLPAQPGLSATLEQEASRRAGVVDLIAVAELAAGVGAEVGVLAAGAHARGGRGNRPCC